MSRWKRGKRASEPQDERSHRHLRSPVFLTKLLIAMAGVLWWSGSAARADKVYVAFDGGNDTVEQYVSGEISGTNYDGAPFITHTNLATDNGIAFDGSGNLYVSNSNNGEITKFDKNGNPGGANGVFYSGLSNPAGIAFDQSGNLYVANNGNGTITKITTSGSGTTLVSGLSGPNGLAFGSNGNLYVADGNDNSIIEISTITGGTSLFASASQPGVGFNGLNQPMDLAFDKSGNLYVANFSGNNIANSNIAVFSGTGAPEGVFANSSLGLANPHGLAFDSSGDLFEVNYYHTGEENDQSPGSSTVEEFAPAVFSSGEVLPGTLLNAFNENPDNLEDGGYIAIETDSGVPLLDSVPEPSTGGFFIFGAISLAGFAWIGRRRA